MDEQNIFPNQDEQSKLPDDIAYKTEQENSKKFPIVSTLLSLLFMPLTFISLYQRKIDDALFAFMVVVLCIIVPPMLERKELSSHRIIILLVYSCICILIYVIMTLIHFLESIFRAACC
ncbi:MAG: hypothetical protein IKI22_01315 [Neisseriaceae bacterium]|nr:hypothetical protein [Neisseriaceae bacterium]